MIFEFPAYGTKQVEKSNIFWGNLFWDTARNRSAKFKHHKKSENFKFEETNNTVLVLSEHNKTGKSKILPLNNQESVLSNKESSTLSSFSPTKGCICWGDILKPRRQTRGEGGLMKFYLTRKIVHQTGAKHSISCPCGFWMTPNSANSLAMGLEKHI